MIGRMKYILAVKNNERNIKMKILAIIPARGGSKKFPGKNIRRLCGKPLIGWTIEAALESDKIDRLVCSTDDKRIAKIAESMKCDVPFLRPIELAADGTKLVHAILHTIDWLEKRGEVYDIVMTLQCTSPMRNTDDINRAIDIFVEKEAESLFSICEMEHPVFWCYTLDNLGRLKPLFQENYVAKRRQELPKTYLRNGAIFINKINALKKWKDFTKPKPHAYIMNRDHSVDVDDKNDFFYAEHLINKLRK